MVVEAMDEDELGYWSSVWLQTEVSRKNATALQYHILNLGTVCHIPSKS